MQLGMVGLGRMGGNLARRLARQGHECVVFDENPAAVASLAEEPVQGGTDLADLVRRLAKPRAVWVMLPAGEITEQTVAQLGSLLEPGDTIIDGGNTFFQDDVRRAGDMKAKGVHYLDCGTSGGVWGLERGYCLMIGGAKEAVDRLDPIFQALSPGGGTIAKTPHRDDRDPRVERGYLHCGPSGAGHFVKMIHNGIEYGMMQAFAEGFSIMKHKTEFHLDLQEIAEIWRHGSVVRSWLLDLTARALEGGTSLENIRPWVSDSGEGRWTVAEAIDLNVPAPVITHSLLQRLRSRDEESYADRLLAVMREQFGGHAVKREEGA